MKKTLGYSVALAAGMFLTTSFSSTLAIASPAADGIEKHHALVLNSSKEPRFWSDIENIYQMFQEKGLSNEDIYLLNHNGSNPEGINPNGMIDYELTTSTLDLISSHLSQVVDGDDVLHVWIDGHGNGYDHFQGYVTTDVTIDPNDEQDLIESEFAAYVNRQYRDGAIGLNEWFYNEFQGQQSRFKYVSHYENLYISELDETISDQDVQIELITDYLIGDTNKNGIIEPELGEYADFDGDGIPGWDIDTKTFDEDDWGDLDSVSDANLQHSAISHACESFEIIDFGLDNTFDVDCNPDGNGFVVDGTDINNDGIFDGVDINSDGDKDDWLSIDETYSMPSGRITDDQLAQYFENIDAGKIVFVMEPCNSGGYIDDLSGPNRILLAAIDEEGSSVSNTFIRNVTQALWGKNVSGWAGVNQSNTDLNGDGVVDMLEAFKAGVRHTGGGDMPVYDDNGDAVYTYGDQFGINQGAAEGNLGSLTTIGSLGASGACEEVTAANSAHVDAGRAYSETTTSWWWSTTTYYAQGSADNLGTVATTQTTLFSTVDGVWEKGNCPEGSAPVVQSITIEQDAAKVRVSGTAIDADQDYERVEVELNNSGQWLVADGLSSWAYDFGELPAGSYTVKARSVDQQGMISSEISDSFEVSGPSAPVINSYTVQRIITSVRVDVDVIDANDDIAELTMYLDGIAIDCEVEGLKCQAGDLVKGETYQISFVAVDATGLSSDIYGPFEYAMPADNTPALLTVGDYSYSNGIMTISGTASDIDGDLDTILIGMGDMYMPCEGKENWVCNISIAEGVYELNIMARDTYHNDSEKFYFTADLQAGPTCITAANTDHLAGGRATEKYGVLYYAVGSNDYLGLNTATTSLEQVSEGNWSKVSSCQQ